VKDLRQLVARVGAGAVGLGVPLAFLTLFFAWPAAMLIAIMFVMWPGGGSVQQIKSVSGYAAIPRAFVVARGEQFASSSKHRRVDSHNRAPFECVPRLRRSFVMAL